MSFITTKKRLTDRVTIESSVDIPDVLTQLGLETVAIPSPLKIDPLVVVGCVVSVEKHPNADRLNVCRVTIGLKQPLIIVCGCPTVRAGMRVPVAQVGAKLLQREIKRSKIRGVESHGMLCAPGEVGFLSSRPGLFELADDAKVGVLLSDHLHLPEMVYEVDITPNRGDCVSDIGIARDLSAKLSQPLVDISVKDVRRPNSSEHLFVVNDDQVHSFCAAEWSCSQEMLRTPDVVLSTLSLSGIRSIHPVVDVLHYVMLITGQPFHAYSRKKVKGTLEVVSVDNQEFQALANDQPIEISGLVVKTDEELGSLAGVIGGQCLSVDDEDCDFIIEAASFCPQLITKTVQKYGIHTDSSYRFTRGVDPEMTEKSLHYALTLLNNFFGGELCGYQAYRKDQKKCLIDFNPDLFQRIIGDPPRERWLDDLQSLGFRCDSKKGGKWLVGVPSFRFDVSEPIDLVEELLRIAGYDSVSDGHAYPHVELKDGHSDFYGLSVQDVRQRLVGMGYHEVINYSFYSEVHHKIMGDSGPEVKIVNPSTEDLKYMRSSLLPSLLGNLSRYVRHQGESIKLFEWAPVYVGEDPQAQVSRISGVCMGGALDWRKQSRDVFMLKQEWAQLSNHLPENCVKWDVEGMPMPFHPHASIRLSIALSESDKPVVGYMGLIHPRVLQELGINQDVCAFDYPVDCLLSMVEKKHQTQSNYPSIRRDLSLVIQKHVSFQDLMALIRQCATLPIKEIRLFDVYHAGDESVYSLSIRFQSIDRTLKDAEVQKDMDTIIDKLKEKLDIDLKV